MPRGRFVTIGAVAFGGVVGVGAAADSRDGDGDSTRAGATTRTGVLDSVPIRCDVGERPRYFVPADSPPALLGCARLGVSRKRVDFSGSLSRIDGEYYLCIDPAYSGRGRRGFFIPGLCTLDQRPSRFAIRDAGQPRQGVRGYRYVIWGTAPRATPGILARFDSVTAGAAVFKVPSRRAPWTFGKAPFALFVVELPLAAACGSVTLVREGSGASKRVRPHGKLCERARDHLQLELSPPRRGTRSPSQ